MCVYMSVCVWPQVLNLACSCMTDGPAILFSPCACSLLSFAEPPFHFRLYFLLTILHLRCTFVSQINNPCSQYLLGFIYNSCNADLCFETNKSFAVDVRRLFWHQWTPAILDLVWNEKANSYRCTAVWVLHCAEFCLCIVGRISGDSLWWWGVASPRGREAERGPCPSFLFPLFTRSRLLPGNSTSRPVAWVCRYNPSTFVIGFQLFPVVHANSKSSFLIFSDHLLWDLQCFIDTAQIFLIYGKYSYLQTDIVRCLMYILTYNSLLDRQVQEDTNGVQVLGVLVFPSLYFE